MVVESSVWLAPATAVLVEICPRNSEPLKQKEKDCLDGVHTLTFGCKYKAMCEEK